MFLCHLSMCLGDGIEFGRAQFDAGPEQEVEVEHVVLYQSKSVLIPPKVERVHTMITKKSLLGSVNEYRFVTQVSQDLRAPILESYRVARFCAAVSRLSYAFWSWSSSHAFRAQGEIMKLRSWVVFKWAFWWRLRVHHLHAYCNWRECGSCGRPEYGGGKIT